MILANVDCANQESSLQMMKENCLKVGEHSRSITKFVESKYEIEIIFF